MVCAYIVCITKDRFWIAYAESSHLLTVATSLHTMASCVLVLLWAIILIIFGNNLDGVIHFLSQIAATIYLHGNLACTLFQ